MNPISRLDKLQWLSIHTMPVNDLSPLHQLNQLKWLYAFNTNVTDLSPLSHLTQLRELSLYNTNVSDLNSLILLTRLEWLDISNCKIIEFPEYLLQLNLAIKKTNDNKPGIFIANNPWNHPPLEILLKGIESTNSYFKSLKNKLSKPLNEVKVILVGDGAAGKTSLVRRLVGQDFNLNEPQSHGILIQQTSFLYAEESVQVNLWDFGGQEIMHSTHQFFLTQRSVYVLVQGFLIKSVVES